MALEAVGSNPIAHPMKKALAKASAFFNEIRLQRVKCTNVREIWLRHVKCASRVRRRISFHMRHRRIFHDARQRVISHFAVRQNISLKLLPVAYINKYLQKSGSHKEV